jgi:hypothetical protein
MLDGKATMEQKGNLEPFQWCFSDQRDRMCS